MDGKTVSESSPLLTVDDHLRVASHTENAGGSAINGDALRRNEQDCEFAVFTKL
jgi:hypothetical protein